MLSATLGFDASPRKRRAGGGQRQNRQPSPISPAIREVLLTPADSAIRDEPDGQASVTN